MHALVDLPVGPLAKHRYLRVIAETGRPERDLGNVLLVLLIVLALEGKTWPERSPLLLVSRPADSSARGDYLVDAHALRRAS